MVFKKGSLIAKSKPFAYVIADSERGKRCEVCLQLNEDLLRCTRCKFAKYCNKNCQTQGWILHKLECRHLMKAHPNGPPELARLMALIILKLKLKDGNNEEEKIGNVSRKYSSLEDHVEDLKMDKERCEEFEITRNILEKYLGQDLLPPVSELFTHFGNIIVNSYSLSEVDSQPKGIGLYLGASGLHHSCKPNAIVADYGLDMQIYALEDIDHSDTTKITVSYIDVLSTTSIRREILRKLHYFTCNCAMCNDHDRDASMNSARCGNVSCTQSIDPCTDHGETLKKCKSLLRDCSLYLHPLNFRLVKVWGLAMDACIELQMWELGLEYGKNMLPAYRLYYGNTHRKLGILLMKIGRSQLFLGNVRREADKTLTECCHILQLNHEKPYPLYRILRSYVNSVNI